MTKISHFKKKGGTVLWIEGIGCQASWSGEIKKMLIDINTGDVFRATDSEWNSPPENLTRCKTML